MTSQPQLLDLFVEVTRMVVDDDVVDLMHVLTVNAAAVSGAAAVGVVLTDHQPRVRYLASSNQEGRTLELFQIQSQEGPCLDAVRTARPVVNAGLGDAVAVMRGTAHPTDRRIADVARSVLAELQAPRR
jgi:hypothetical protein